MKNNICLYCGEPFSAEHGNQQYCPDTDCALLAKLERQSVNYEIGDDAKKAIQKNRKILNDVLLDDMYRELDLMTVLKLGFDQSGFFGMSLLENPKRYLFQVHDFYFNITSGNPQKIQIWKALIN